MEFQSENFVQFVPQSFFGTFVFYIFAVTQVVFLMLINAIFNYVRKDIQPCSILTFGTPLSFILLVF